MASSNDKKATVAGYTLGELAKAPVKPPENPEPEDEKEENNSKKPAPNEVKTILNKESGATIASSFPRTKKPKKEQ